MDDFFSDTRPGTTVTHGRATFELPILYRRDDTFVLFFTADREKVTELMPSARLHPATLVPGGRALVGIAAFHYADTSIGPYGELGVVVPVVHGDRRPWPLLPMLREGSYPGFGAVVLHLPVTTAEARDAGRGEWGYAKFVADMRFDLTPAHLQCRVEEAGAHVLTVRVARRGRASRDRRPLVTYSVRGGDLVKTVIPQEAVVRNSFRPGDSFVELGDHPVADTVRGLGLSERPVLARHFVERSAILPAGEVVERGVRALEGYAGVGDEGSLKVEDRTG